MTGACRVCGWDVAPHAVTCRWCDEAFNRAMEKAKRPIRDPRKQSKLATIEIDDDG